MRNICFCKRFAVEVKCKNEKCETITNTGRLYRNACLRCIFLAVRRSQLSSFQCHVRGRSQQFFYGSRTYQVFFLDDPTSKKPQQPLEGCPLPQNFLIGNLVVRASDLWLNRREFDPWPMHYRSVGTGMDNRLRVGIPSRYITSHRGLLSLLPSAGWKMSTGQSGDGVGQDGSFCLWTNVWVAGKYHHHHHHHHHRLFSDSRSIEITIKQHRGQTGKYVWSVVNTCHSGCFRGEFSRKGAIRNVLSSSSTLTSPFMYTANVHGCCERVALVSK